MALVSCSLAQEERARIAIPKYPDPEHASMAGKARVLVAYDSLSPGWYDSLIVDEKGRTIQRSGYGVWKSLDISLFDTSNFPIRTYHRSDIVTNYLYDYFQVEDTLFQKVFDLPSWKFEYQDTLVNREAPTFVNYFLIQNGRISMEFNKGFITNYEYDNQNRLKKSIGTSNYPTKLKRVELYTYSGESSFLNQKILIVNDDTVRITRYQNGILYSIEEGFGSEFTFSLFYQ